MLASIKNLIKIIDSFYNIIYPSYFGLSQPSQINFVCFLNFFYRNMLTIINIPNFAGENTVLT